MHLRQCIGRHGPIVVERFEPVLEPHRSHAGWLAFWIILDAVVGRVVEQFMIDIFEEEIIEMTASVLVQGNS